MPHFPHGQGRTVPLAIGCRPRVDDRQFAYPTSAGRAALSQVDNLCLN
jgi:hypothetical protein